MIRILCQQRPSVLGRLRRARVHPRTPDLHHRLAVRLLAVRRRHLPHLALDAVLRRGERQRRSPLPRPRLGGELGDALGVVVMRLRHGGVGLVRAGRADAFVLEVDLGGRVERGFEPAGPVQRARAPQPVHVQHAAGDVDVGLAADLLQDQPHREQRGEVVGPDRLERARMQGRRWRGRQIRHDVVPLGGHLGFVQNDLGRAVAAVSAHGVFLPVRLPIVRPAAACARTVPPS